MAIPSIEPALAGLLEGYSLVFPTYKQQEAIRTGITKELKIAYLPYQPS